MLKVWYLPLAALAAGFAVAGWLFLTLPSTFLPDEDQGALFVNIQLLDAASLSRTEEIVDQVTRMVSDTDGVNMAISVAGFSILQGTVAPNGGMVIASLKPWYERTDDAQQLQAMISKMNQQFAAIPGAVIGVFAPPSISGIGAVGGLNLRLQALAGQSPEELAEVLQSFITNANQAPEIGGLRSTFSASVPLVRDEVNRTRAERLGLSVSDIYDVIGANFGSSYVNDFIKGGRVFQVNIEADAEFRATADDILKLEARNSDGQMVPLEVVIFGMALLFAYLFLVVLYESWMLPVAIILSLGAAAFGAMVALWVVGMPTSLYVQIALVLLIGLAARTRFLIVEFAKDRSAEGQSPLEAARNRSEARFRAVLMTSLAFIFGLVPLALSSGRRRRTERDRCHRHKPNVGRDTDRPLRDPRAFLCDPIDVGVVRHGSQGRCQR